MTSRRRSRARTNATRVAAIGTLALFVACVSCSVSLFAPFWLQHPKPGARPGGSGKLQSPGGGSLQNDTSNSVSSSPTYGLTGDEWIEGLWAKCYRTDSRCDWSWWLGDDVLPGWHRAAQIFYTTGTALMFVALTLSVAHVCFAHCPTSLTVSFVISSIGVAAIVTLLVALAVYAGFIISEHQSATDQTFANANNSVKLGWAFYVAVLGVASTLIASALFFWDGRHVRQKHGYMKAASDTTQESQKDQYGMEYLHF